MKPPFRATALASLLVAGCANVWEFEDGTLGGAGGAAGTSTPTGGSGGHAGAGGVSGAGGGGAVGGACNPPCDSPPNSACYEPIGTCTGGTPACAYPPLANGTSCGDTTCGEWDACVWDGPCSNGGSHTRQCVDLVCTDGGCEPTTRQETGDCSRTINNGTSCSGGYCCSGSCVARNSDAHCGSCGIDCGAETCVEITTHPGQYSCTCYGTQQCKDLGFGPLATCWNGDGQMICNCQCGGTGDDQCAGQCAGGGTCAQVVSHNYCHY